jgi:hypothetical protein
MSRNWTHTDVAQANPLDSTFNLRAADGNGTLVSSQNKTLGNGALI